MTDDTQHGQIMNKLGILEGKVDGILTRQDTANGRTSKLEGKVELIEKKQAGTDSRFATAAWIFGATVALIGLAFVILTFYKK